MKWLVNLESKLLQKNQIEVGKNVAVGTYVLGIRLSPTQLGGSLDLEWGGSPKGGYNTSTKLLLLSSLAIDNS